MKIHELITRLEQFAPLAFQESYDNAGVQVGDTQQSITGVLLCLDITEEVLEEAIELGCNLIIAHHPLLFKGLKSISGKTYIERCVRLAIQNQLTLYAAHTNLDSAYQGVSYKLAQKMGLINPQTLAPQTQALLKLVTFVPEAEADMVRKALFAAGAGHIGNYDCCSFNSIGQGTFRGDAYTHPFCGTPGELHTEQEIKIETILPRHKKGAVVRALCLVHPYEEPAFDLYPLENDWAQTGMGVLAELPAEEDALSFLQRLKDILQLNCIQHSQIGSKKVKKIALCGGSGASLLPHALAAGADVFITGEAKYNDFYDVEDKILLTVIGHYESEICTKELFFDIITKILPNFAVHFSNANVNPINYLT